MACKYPDEIALLKDAVKRFTKEFKSPPEVAAGAPGRVNLIGEHTDYNDGFVLPMALPMATVVVGKKNDKDTCCVVAMAKEADKPVKVEFPIPSQQELVPDKPKWSNYVKGVVQHFKGTVVGFNAVVNTSVPIGGGLSSSASLEVAMYTFLEAITGETDGGIVGPDGDQNPGTIGTKWQKEKALACQKAEHEFASMPCGIMDQFISTMGSAGNALFIDCRNMEASSVPIDDPEIAIIIANSKVKHDLASSKYSERREECRQAAEAMGKSSLRDATEEDCEGLKETNETLYKRALHVVTENSRTQQAAQALRDGDLKTFGELMKASHESLRDNFEVSCKEVDALVDAANEQPEVLGSRMTGGGFGGCTVTLAPAKYADKLIAAIKKKSKVKAIFYITKPSDGARLLAIPAGK